MSPRLQSLLAHIGALALIAGGFFFLAHPKFSDIAAYAPENPPVSSSGQTAAADAGQEAPPPPISVATTSPKTPRPTHTVISAAKLSAQKPALKKEPDNEITRVKDPYPFPSESFAAVNDATRPALVNILCMPRGGTLQPISGSGVIIDPRGVILTNAHVAQYVLLSESPQINLSCIIRTGSPATPRWSAEILYIPPAWVEAHAQEIKNPHPVGTGEHDYGLLLITGSADGSPPSAPPAGGFPSLPSDTREAIGFEGDPVLVASYPAEFIGGLAAQFNLFPASSITSIRQLLTFSEKSVDLLSLGGIIEAQSGSSGGAVVNAWGRLVGIISTTSEGATTADRDLRALTLSYISRDLAAQTQFDLPTILGGDVGAEALDFNTRVAPNLIRLFIEQIAK